MITALDHFVLLCPDLDEAYQIIRSCSGETQRGGLQSEGAELATFAVGQYRNWSSWRRAVRARWRTNYVR